MNDGMSRLWLLGRSLLVCLVWWHAQDRILAATQTETSLLLDQEETRPGTVVWAGIRLQSPTGWHTYWQNAGDSGAPTSVQWTLPTGISAGPIQWPIPQKYTQADLTTYIYSGEVVLLVPLMVDARCSPGRYDLKAAVSWLECEKACVPGDARVEASLTVSNAIKPAKLAAQLESWKARLPQTATNLLLQVSWGSSLSTNTRTLSITWDTSFLPDTIDFLPLAGDGYEVAAATQVLTNAPGKVVLRKTVKQLGDQWPPAIPGLLIGKLSAEAQTSGYQVTLVPESATPAASLWLMLFYAFLGGLILNVMPCVLPVIALKILGFVNQSRDAPQQVRFLGLLYTLGVLASFLVLAAAVIAVQQAGRHASWGMQFGDPMFLVALCVLVTLVALNLFGVFEVNLGGRVMGAAGDLAAHEGKAGAFFNGVLATALATPCTAPFLGAALGFAFIQPAPVILLFFLTVGLGLALPYLLLSWQPAWLKFLPRPGTWMVRFKVAMGFPMLATAIWLYSLAATHYGKRTLWLGLFLVLAAMSAWIYGELSQRARKHRALGAIAAGVLLLVNYAYTLEAQLQWRHPPSPSNTDTTLQESPEGIPWQRWSNAAVAHARTENRVVLVDFTADWCLTCNANKKFSLDIALVRQRLKELKAAAFLADYTRPAASPEITAELARFGRAGVPLVLVYPRNPEKPPVPLPELLTPQIVMDALETAAK